MAAHTRQIPPWLMGLMLAVVLTVIVIVTLKLFGYGDNPVVDPEGLAFLLL